MMLDSHTCCHALAHVVPAFLALNGIILLSASVLYMDAYSAYSGTASHGNGEPVYSTFYEEKRTRRNFTVDADAYYYMQTPASYDYSSSQGDKSSEDRITVMFGVIWLGVIVVVLLDLAMRYKCCRLEQSRLKEIETMAMDGVQGWTAGCTPQEECVICLDIFAEGDSCIKLPCGHHFHDKCILECLRKSQEYSTRTCPTCRQTCLLCDFEDHNSCTAKSEAFFDGVTEWTSANLPELYNEHHAVNSHRTDLRLV